MAAHRNCGDWLHDSVTEALELLKGGPCIEGGLQLGDAACVGKGAADGCAGQAGGSRPQNPLGN